MEEDIYNRFKEKVKGSPSYLKNKDRFIHSVFNNIEENKNRKRRISFIVNFAASILFILCIGTYTWQEVWTYENRMQLRSKMGDLSPLPEPQWQCRQSLKNLMSALIHTKVISINDNRILLKKSEVEILKSLNRPLYDQLQKLLSVLQTTNPGLYHDYIAGQLITLSAWELRNEYQICDWLTP